MITQNTAELHNNFNYNWGKEKVKLVKIQAQWFGIRQSIAQLLCNRNYDFEKGKLVKEDTNVEKI